jgi:hypothetical protein
MKFPGCLIGGLGVVAATVAIAHAGGPLARPSSPDARAHLDRGIKLYEVRSFAEAIAEFKAGAIIESVPVFDYNLGQCYRQLGKYEDALWHYDRFLNYGNPSGELRDAVVAFIAEMRAHLANRALTMPPTEAARPAENDVRPKMQSPGAEPASPPLRDQSSRHDWIGWGLTGGGVASIGAAGLLFWNASTIQNRASTEPNMQMRVDLRNQGDHRALIGGIVGAAGVVLIGVGALHFLMHSPEPSSRGVAALRIGVTGSGAYVTGQF